MNMHNIGAAPRKPPTCRQCLKRVSREARTCPNCGNDLRMAIYVIYAGNGEGGSTFTKRLFANSLKDAEKKFRKEDEHSTIYCIENEDNPSEMDVRRPAALNL